LALGEVQGFLSIIPTSPFHLTFPRTEIARQHFYVSGAPCWANMTRMDAANHHRL
jgi:hypothetical protein